MTNDDIIRLANEARLCGCKWVNDDDDRDVESLYDFVALVAAAEREACAVVAFNAKTYIAAANAIRARGQPEPEPVCDKDPRGCWSVRCQLAKVCKNTAPPQREWVGLTDDETNTLIQKWAGELVFEVTQALKEKNK